jgi:transposase InsO family protein
LREENARLKKLVADRVLTGRNQEWAIEFVNDAVESGRAIRVLSVVDVHTRECLAPEVDTSFASRRTTRVREHLLAQRGAPGAIRCDNGPELTSCDFLAWCIERKIEMAHIQPGRPMQNGHVESFHGKLRDECLRVSWFGKSIRGAAEDRSVAERVQRRSPAQQFGVSDASRARARTERRNRLWKRRGLPPWKTLRVSHFPTATTATAYAPFEGSSSIPT